jgi:hypothetical protein
MARIQITVAAQAGDTDILYFDWEYFSQKIQDAFCVTSKGGLNCNARSQVVTILLLNIPVFCDVTL